MQKVKCDKCGNLMQVKCAMRPKTTLKKCRFLDATAECRVICGKCEKVHTIRFTFRKE